VSGSLLNRPTSLKAHVAAAAVYMHAMQSSLFPQLIKLPPCGSYKAPDTELKQWAIYEVWFEPSNPPANTPQSLPAKKARAGPLDVLDAIYWVHQRPHQPRHWWMLNCPCICRPTLSVKRNRRLIGGQQTLPGTRCWLQKPSAISATVKIGSKSEIGNKLT